MALRSGYRGRLAPSPTGYLHVGHARTFCVAATRAADAGGELILRNDDLDRDRVRPGFVTASLEDLRWLGMKWTEGPDLGGPYAPYSQSDRLPLYREALERLHAGGWVYPCRCSRRDILAAIAAPHAGEDEPLYPGTCRNAPMVPLPPVAVVGTVSSAEPRISWRFRVPEGEVVSFRDGHFGEQRFVAGSDFGDFVVWRPDGLPAYQLACVVDDAAMRITEVVRGADLLASTARQLLLYRALGLVPPEFFHAPLVTDATGQRLAKRHDSLSLRALRQRGLTPTEALAVTPG
jgi:glutamyl-tRNA synthetase